MRTVARRWSTAGALLLVAGLSATVAAQPGRQGQAGRQERRAAIKKDVQEMRAKFVAQYGEQLAELKLKGEEIRAAYSDEVEHFKDLVARAQKGELTPAEQAELDVLKKKADEAKKKLQALQPGDVSAAVKKAISDNQTEILAVWGAWILKSSDAQSELEKNARRVAALEQAKAVATAQGREDLVAHVDELAKAENTRHEAAMKLLKTQSGEAKGAP
jgi:hypothetical protein